jgi:hypothetical protein
MPRLKTETNTPAMEKKVAAAFRESKHAVSKYSTDFEHGQWWVTAMDSGRQWSVVDAEGPGSVHGFDFEVVTEGDSDG